MYLFNKDTLFAAPIMKKCRFDSRGSEAVYGLYIKITMQKSN